MKKFLAGLLAALLSPMFLVGAIAFVVWEWANFGWRTMEDLL